MPEDRGKDGRFPRGVSGNVEAQFKKGKSGNPKGRPPSIMRVIREKLNENPELLDELAEKLLEEASRGGKDGIAALRVLLDRLDGAVVQRHEVGPTVSPAQALTEGTDDGATGRAARTFLEAGSDDGSEVPPDPDGAAE